MEMGQETTTISSESFPMKGGDGPNSYVQNSMYQRIAIESARNMIDKAIAEKLDVKRIFSNCSSSSPFNIADLGCSTGPNTFIAVQNIIEAINLKFQSHSFSSQPLEIQVFFNDHASNDFNNLFTSLPPDRRYFAAGVPGSFHGRLFPSASLHFVISSYALQWLSKVPNEVVDHNSTAWNKGKIHYTNATKEVAEAYSTQFNKDMESFLYARAQELVSGGLMSFLLPCIPDGPSHIQSRLASKLDLLGSVLMDMAKMGIFNEAKVDSFNIPFYNPSPKELKALIEENGCFSIERMEPLKRLGKNAHLLPPTNAKTITMEIRAAFEEVIKEHFGSEIIQDLFDRLAGKLEESMFINPEYYQTIELVVILKRKFVD